MTESLYSISEITEFRREQEKALNSHLISHELWNIFKHPGKYVVTKFPTPGLPKTLKVNPSEIVSDFYSSENDIPKEYQTTNLRGLPKSAPFIVSKIPTHLEEILIKGNSF